MLGYTRNMNLIKGNDYQDLNILFEEKNEITHPFLLKTVL